MKSFRKIVWINFFVAIVAVNVVSELGEYYLGIYIAPLLRLAFITGITIGMTILAGSMYLVLNMSKEVPHSEIAHDTLAFDRNRQHTPEDQEKLDKLNREQEAKDAEKK